MRNFPIVIVAAAAAGTATLGCRHAMPAAAEGASSFSFVAPPPASRPPQKKAGPPGVAPLRREVVVPPRPIGTLVTPVYPRAALARRAGEAMVGVQLTLGLDGRVNDVTTSLAALSSPGPLAGEFRAAVEEAVRQWRFHPAEIRQIETVKHAQGDYLHLAGTEKIEWRFDVQFRFSASGAVVSDGAK
ncbi:MAG: energy transducer TonB [Verrucomicrobia bacterium]|nr:energy transducer TonB [Verrucomicrobiota bacterium]